ncbi:MAG TPA: SpoIIE family protein phosphatase, partial [Bacteroidia bacterium]|nr:SpoIIE family protein phosphatase [Bacteroidia bacterium]
LEYAGAGAPLYLVRDGKLEEIKPAKCTVGSIQPHIKEPPKTHAFHLRPGDAFYLCSDGIADQFGGKDGKKFRREQVKAMIASLHPVAMEQQQDKAEKIIGEWMKGFAQTDDMLLAGIRI